MIFPNCPPLEKFAFQSGEDAALKRGGDEDLAIARLDAGTFFQNTGNHGYLFCFSLKRR